MKNAKGYQVLFTHHLKTTPIVELEASTTILVRMKIERNNIKNVDGNWKTIITSLDYNQT